MFYAHTCKIHDECFKTGFSTPCQGWVLKILAQQAEHFRLVEPMSILHSTRTCQLSSAQLNSTQQGSGEFSTLLSLVEHSPIFPKFAS